MGSPNFYTNAEGVNFAIDAEPFTYTPEVDEDEEIGEPYFDESAYRDVSESASELEQKLNDKTFFHSVVMSYGYHEGFQLYIEQQTLEDATVESWNNYKEFSDLNGNGYEDLSEIPYFNKNAKNVTHFSLKTAIKREYDYLAGELTKFAKENYMGEVVGKSWTSCVSYDWLNK